MSQTALTPLFRVTMCLCSREVSSGTQTWGLLCGVVGREHGEPWGCLCQHPGHARLDGAISGAFSTTQRGVRCFYL